MAREWQQKRQREYVMPDEVYYQTLWAVRDLGRMEDQLVLMEADGKYGTIENLSLQSRVNSIKQALQDVPDIYREPILRNIKLRYTGSEFPDVSRYEQTSKLSEACRDYRWHALRKQKFALRPYWRRLCSRRFFCALFA